MHRTRAQLAHDGFPGLRVGVDMSRVEIREREAAVEIRAVVTAGTLCIEHGGDLARAHAAAATGE